MRILQRRSKLAIFTLVLARVALFMMFIIAVVVFTNKISLNELYHGALASTVLAIFALVLVILSMIRLWFNGAIGWGASAFAGVFAVLALIPALAALGVSIQYPSTHYVSTSAYDAPVLSNYTNDSGYIQPDIMASYPNLVTRTYALAPEDLRSSVQNILSSSGDVLAIAATDASDAVVQSELTINAIRKTWFGFQSEWAIRISEGALGSVVDVSAIGLDNLPTDLGENGRWIEVFYSQLDQEVSRLPALETDPMPENGEITSQDIPQI